MNSRRSTAWKATLIPIPLATGGVLFWLRQAEVQQLRNRPLPAYDTVPNFELTNQDARPFGSAQLAGKIWIADFIFTSCPGPCPIISSRMSELQKPLEKSDVHLVSLTVDPEKDTPDVLRASCRHSPRRFADSSSASRSDSGWCAGRGG